jgi:hypothetical protein
MPGDIGPAKLSTSGDVIHIGACSFSHISYARLLTTSRPFSHIWYARFLTTNGPFTHNKGV